MKEQIQKLIELAKLWVDFAISVDQKQSHVYYDNVRVYLNDNNETQEVDIFGISITFYSKKITFPFSSTIESLQLAIKTGTDDLNNFKLNHATRLKKENDTEKLIRINHLKKELEFLKNK